MAEYRRSAQSRGYRPGRVDQSNIQRMREDSNRTVQYMRQRAEMEISDRRRNLAQTKEDQAATKRMEEKNFQIQTQNIQNEIKGIQLKQQAEERQLIADTKANQTIFNTIADLSVTAAKIHTEIQQQQAQDKYTKDYGDQTVDDGLDALAKRNDLNALGIGTLASIQNVEARGTADPRVLENAKGSDPALAVNYTLGNVAGWSRRGGYERFVNTRMAQYADQKAEAGLGALTYQDKQRIIAESQQIVKEMYSGQYDAKYVKAELDFQNQVAARFLKKASDEEISERKEQRRSMALANIESAPPELFNTTFNHSWAHIIDANGGNRTQAWQEVKAALNAQNPVTGEFYRSQGEIDELVIVTKDYPKGIKFGELYSNKQGLPVGIRREIISDRMERVRTFERQQEQLDAVRHKEYEQELVRAVQLNPTIANITEAQRKYVEKTQGKVSQALNNISKYTSIEAIHRNNEFERIAALPDHELTQELVNVAKENNPTGGAEVQQRYDNGPGQLKTKKIEDRIKKAESVITGTTKLGTTSDGKAGSLPARLYFTAQIRQKARLAFNNGENGFTAEEAVANAIAEEEQIYKDQYLVPGTTYYRDVHTNGTVSYPGIESKQGDVVAAEKSYRKMQTLRRQVKSIGFNGVLNIPHSVMTPERMEYIAQNPNTAPTAEERQFVQYSNGMPMHEFRNRAFAAAGRTERFESPLKPYNILFTPEQQRIINDADASF